MENFIFCTVTVVLSCIFSHVFDMVVMINIYKLQNYRKIQGRDLSLYLFRLYYQISSWSNISMLACNMNKLVMLISTFSMSFLIEETQLQNYLEVFDFWFSLGTQMVLFYPLKNLRVLTYYKYSKWIYFINIGR